MEYAALIVAVATLTVLFLALAVKGKRRPQRREPKVTRKGEATEFQQSAQLDHIAKVAFERKPILNKAEQRVFAALEGIVAEIGGGHRVMAQTCMGEVLQPVKDSGEWPDRKRAFLAINSKRFDFAVLDAAGMLVMAVEYQGAGHHQKKAFIRDAVKREVCRRASVPFVEVEQGTTPTALRDRVRETLGVQVLAAE